MGFFGRLFASGSAVVPEALPDPAILIDVRSPAEFAAGHIRDAISLPLICLSQDIGGVVADRTVSVIVYCQSGARSASARQQLLDLGYRHVVNGGGLHVLALRMNREIFR
jgi:phage shock protein E